MGEPERRPGSAPGRIPQLTMAPQSKPSHLSQAQPSPKSKLGPQRAGVPAAAAAAPHLSAPALAELRRLAHDLGNSLESAMAACYLLSQNQLEPASQRWVGLIDQAARAAARINREIRDLLRAQIGS